MVSNPEWAQALTLVVQLLTGVVLPFVVAYLSKLSWRTEHKWLLALGLSLLTAVLSALRDGTVSGADVVSSLTVIFTTTQVVYMTFFKALGLEAWMYPERGLADAVKRVAEQTIEALPPGDVDAILDPAKPDRVVVSVERTATPGNG